MNNEDNDKEKDAFLAAMRGVQPLPNARAMIIKPKSEPCLAQRARRKAAVTPSNEARLHNDDPIQQIAPNDLIGGKIEGVQQTLYRKLQQGKLPLQAQLDLHQRTVKEAHADLLAFIQDCLRYDLRTVIITHGKGERSRTPARIKSFVNQWLQELPQVLAYHSAQPRHGGSGAVYVLLKKSPHKEKQHQDKHR